MHEKHCRIDDMSENSERDDFRTPHFSGLKFFARILRRPRAERRALMNEDILDVEGAAKELGVSTKTIYNLARKGEIPAMRIGRAWRFSRKNLAEWVVNSGKGDQLTAALANGRIVRRQS